VGPRAWVKDSIGRFAPRLLWRHRIKSWHISAGEAEQELLSWMCDRDKISLDIGAAAGSYVAHMLLYSARVVAFEPRKEGADGLRSNFGNTKLVTVEEVALSNEAGTAEIRIPAGRPLLSTIDPQNRLDDKRAATYSVMRRRLDDYAFRSVGFIKIDVEGHEQAVLEGARATLAREKPFVLIEAEERHNAGTVRAVARFFEALSYLGFFFDGTLRPMAEFDLEMHQNPSHLSDGRRRIGIYINNFIFAHRENVWRIPRRYLASGCS
jgi:FkbM family methyltransferase